MTRLKLGYFSAGDFRMFQLKHCKLSVLLSLFFVVGFSDAANPILKGDQPSDLTTNVNPVNNQRPLNCTVLINSSSFLEQASDVKKGVTYFSHDSILISQPFVELIANLADKLSHNSESCVFLAGFSDSTGPVKYNQQLSVKRAHEVAKMMIYLGASPEQIITMGYGEQLGKEEPELAKQRRVEWYFLPEHQEV